MRRVRFVRSVPKIAMWPASSPLFSRDRLPTASSAFRPTAGPLLAAIARRTTSVRELSGIAPGEKIINWHADSNNVFLAHPDGINVQVYNLNLTTGERKLWTMFSPPDKTALAGHSLVYITPDGAHFGYESHRVDSTVFIAKGLR